MSIAPNNFELIYDKAKKYTETSIELYKLKLVDKSSDIISSLAYKLVLGLAVAMFTLFINIGLSLYLGQIFDNNYTGFFIVSLFYLAIALIVFIFGNTLIKIPVSDLVITKLLKSTKIGKSILDPLKEKQNDTI